MHPVHEGLLEMLAAGPVVMSGAVGTELLRRGYDTPTPLWSTAPLLSAPEAVRALHAEYVRAGARIVTANTFRTDRVSLSKAGLGARTRELNKLAVTLARQGVADAAPKEPVLVAGSISPVEDCYRPDLVPDDQTLHIEHGVKVGHLVAARASFALVETMNTAREARIALGAAAAGRLPAMVSFVVGPDGSLLSGESLADAVAAVTPEGPMAILVNCCAPDVATGALTVLCEATTLPVGVYANGRGHPADGPGWAFQGGVSRRRYLKHARTWLDLGASFVGGCCGTDPATVKRLARLVARRRT